MEEDEITFMKPTRYLGVPEEAPAKVKAIAAITLQNIMLRNQKQILEDLKSANEWTETREAIAGLQTHKMLDELGRLGRSVSIEFYDGEWLVCMSFNNKLGSLCCSSRDSVGEALQKLYTSVGKV